MKLQSYSVLHHPNLDESFIVRDSKISSWLNKNKAIWEKYAIDVKLFIKEPIWIKDKKLEEALRAAAPELFI